MARHRTSKDPTLYYARNKNEAATQSNKRLAFQPSIHPYIPNHQRGTDNRTTPLGRKHNPEGTNLRHRKLCLYLNHIYKTINTRPPYAAATPWLVFSGRGELRVTTATITSSTSSRGLSLPRGSLALQAIPPLPCCLRLTLTLTVAPLPCDTGR